MRDFIKRIYLLGLVFVLIGGFSILFAFVHLEGQLARGIRETINFKLDHVMGEASMRLLNVERTLDATEVVLSTGADDREIIQFFNGLLIDNDSFLAIYFAVSEDYVLYASRDFEWEPIDPSDRPWYLGAKSEGRLFFTQPYEDAAADRWVLTMAKPIYDQDGQLVGVLGIDESLEGILGSLEKARPSEHGQVFAYYETGQALIGAEFKDELFSAKQGEFILTNIDNKQGYLKWRAVGKSGISLGVFAPIDDFIDYRAMLAQVLLTSFLTFSFLVLVLFVFQRRYIIQPMRRLDNDIMGISLERDVGYRLPKREKSPFDELRKAINLSLDKVQEHFENIINQQDQLTAAYGQLVAHENQLQVQFNEIREKEKEIRFLADHDTLTGLSNRRKLERDLEMLLDEGKSGSVLLFDLDNFKHINDISGHVYGDAVLCHVAEHLQTDIIGSSKLYRFGGDEFLAVIEDVVEQEKLTSIITKVLTDLGQAHFIDGRRNHLTCGVGVVRFPYDGTSVEELLIKADLAVHNAKKAGRNRYVIFEACMSTAFAERVHLQNVLRGAVKTEAFRLLYQPIVKTVGGEITYLEALIRLKGHNLSPTVFIAAAEESDLILSIGRWVIKEAIGQLVAWKNAGKRLIPISINLSPKQFYDEGLVDFLKEELERQKIDPSLLEMEITETVLIDSSSEAVRIIDDIRALGIKIALDDFGTGYLSIKYITYIPVDRIKLDRGMSQGLPDTLPVMEGLITIAHGLGMSVVAEGIERLEDAHSLAQIKCDYLQGYLFSRPLEVEQIELLLNEDFSQLLESEQKAVLS